MSAGLRLGVMWLYIHILLITSTIVKRLSSEENSGHLLNPEEFTSYENASSFYNNVDQSALNGNEGDWQGLSQSLEDRHKFDNEPIDIMHQEENSQNHEENNNEHTDNRGYHQNLEEPKNQENDDVDINNQELIVKPDNIYEYNKYLEDNSLENDKTEEDNNENEHTTDDENHTDEFEHNRINQDDIDHEEHKPKVLHGKSEPGVKAHHRRADTGHESNSSVLIHDAKHHSRRFVPATNEIREDILDIFFENTSHLYNFSDEYLDEEEPENKTSSKTKASGKLLVKDSYKQMMRKRLQRWRQNLHYMPDSKATKTKPKEKKGVIQRIIDFFFRKTTIKPITKKKTTRRTTTTKRTPRPSVRPPRGWMYTRAGHIPTSAFEAARLQNKKLLYIIRARKLGIAGFIPGYLEWGAKIGVIPVRGFTRVVNFYEILIGNQDDYRWIKFTNTAVLKHGDLVIGGWERYTVNTLYVCRAFFYSNIQIGKMDKYGKCYIPTLLEGIEQRSGRGVEILVKMYIPNHAYRNKRGPGFKQK